jgi:TamB, inner membrane protein subunit of TAM complex
MRINKSVRKVVRRIFRIILTIVLILLGLVLLVLVLIQTGPVQNYGRRKMEAYLENKLRTKVRIGNLYIGFPSRIVLKNIYLEDRRKDTLLSGGKIEVDINMLRLLSSELRVSHLELDDVTMKIRRQLPDTVYNFQFIADAFSSPPDTITKKESTDGFHFVIGTIRLQNIHAVYNDDATGNELNIVLRDFNTKLKTFDPSHQEYAIPDINLSGVTGSIRQYKPILILRKVADTVAAHNENSEPVKLQLGNIDFAGISLNYRNEIQQTDAMIHLANFKLISDSIDLATLHLKLKQVSLGNTSAAWHFGKIKSFKNEEKELQKPPPPSKAVWSIDVARLTIDSTDLRYDDDNKKAVKKGIDYSHLYVKHLRIHTSNLHADPSNYNAQIAGISFDEKCGFTLKNLSAGISYNPSGISVKNLVVQTNKSEIRNQTNISYKSFEDFKNNPGNVQTNIEFNQARIATQDILVFVPSLNSTLKNYSQAAIRLNGKISGKLNNLKISYLEFDGLGNTSLAATGEIKGLPKATTAIYNISISKFKTTKTDIDRFVPKGTVPDNLQIPEDLSLTGKFNGSFNHFLVQMHLITNEGSVDITGSLDAHKKIYDLTAHTNSLDLGHILKMDSLMGRFTLNATARGSGFDPKKMNSDFHVSLEEGAFNAYEYRGLVLDAKMDNGNATIVSSMHDPNITYQLNGEASLSGKYPSVKMKLQLDTINLLALNLLKDSLQMHLALDADFKSTDPDALQGQMIVSDIGMKFGKLAINTDSVLLTANHSDTGQSIQIHSEAADIDWTGRYKLTQTTESLKQFINKYYKIRDVGGDTTEPEQWQMSLELRPSPLVLAVMPSLKGSDSLTGHIVFNSSKKDLNLELHTDKIQLDQLIIQQFSVKAETGNNSLNYNISIANAQQPGFQLYQTSLSGALENNKLTNTLHLKDKKAKDKYIMSGSLTSVKNGFQYVFIPDSLLLDYQRWQIPSDNYVRYDSMGIIVKNLKLSHQGESIDINSKSETAESPLEVNFSNFRIKSLTQFAEQDSLMLNGIINGNAEIKNLNTKPIFTSDIKIDSLMYDKDSVGNLVIQVNNTELNAYTAHISLKGHENDVDIDGKYFSGESKMDLDIKMNQLNLASFKGVAVTQVRKLSGYLKGNLHASGNLDHPFLKGSLHFDHAVLVPVITGEPLKLSDDIINFDEDGFDFSNFVMQDSAGNKATLDGNIYTKDYRDYKFDISFNAENFRAVNAPKEPNRMFYGKLNINADIDVSGDMNLPKITSYLRVNKNTDFYVILPSDDPEVVDRNGVVVFVNKNKAVDSSQLKSFLDSLTTHARLKGMDAAVTIETDSSAQFTLIIDERNGDALAVRGRADLTGGVDKSGKISLTGNYELVNGSYNLTLSVLHRSFIIERGSTITWTGDPKTANINISAIYTVNTAPIDLVEQQLYGQSSTDQNRYKEKLPFQVKLIMTGELLKPIVKFDISLPENLLALWPEVDTKLQQMRTDEAEVNKQVFALLLLGRFIQENPFQTAGAPTDAGTIAKQSASKLLSDQLNQLAGSLIKGVDVNFDMNSDQDYSSGTATNQTELNVKVSKSLFSDRIRVTVGSDFQLEQTNPGQDASNIAGDVSVDYKLSKDGRYMLRVFRNDEYETIVQGQVIETGVSFILTFDYNKFRELFLNKKEEPVIPKPGKHPATPSKDNTTIK